MSLPRIHTEILPNGLSLDMILVEGGSFMMGSDYKEDALGSEQPVHSVTIRSFYLGKYLCTQALWEAVMSRNPSRFQGVQRPVEQVSWKDIQTFLKKLNLQIGHPYRLPTEAEWEFAARGGIYSEGYLYAGSDKLKEVGWYKENAGDETRDVGLLLPNELGLYDMSGNLYEWCEDDWHGNYQGAPDDGSAWIYGDKEPESQNKKKSLLGKLLNLAEDTPKKSNRGYYRVLRGGRWSFGKHYCRVSGRYRDTPGVKYDYVGFRLALSPQSAGFLPAIP